MLIDVDLSDPEEVARHTQSGELWVGPLAEHVSAPGYQHDFPVDPRIPRCAIEALSIEDKLDAWQQEDIRCGLRGPIADAERAEVAGAQGYAYPWGLIHERVHRGRMQRDLRLHWDLFVPEAMCSRHTRVFHPREVESMALFYFESLLEEIGETLPKRQKVPLSVQRSPGTFTLITLVQTGPVEDARLFMADEVCSFAMPRLIRFLEVESAALAQIVLAAERTVHAQASAQ